MNEKNVEVVGDTVFIGNVNRCDRTNRCESPRQLGKRDGLAA